MGTMGSDKGHKLSPSPPPSQSLSARGGIPQSALRVRPQAGRISIARKANRPTSFRDECCSAVIPVLVIAAVWCFGCYLYLWISLYRSFTADIDDRQSDHIGIFNKRKDILAIKLEQFLDGSNTNYDVGNISSPENEASSGIGWSSYHPLNVTSVKIDNVLLAQIADPRIQKRVQSTLISHTGYPNLILGAYLEPPLPVEQANADSIQRMKLRTHSPKDLKSASYPYQQMPGDQSKQQIMPGACSQKGAQWIFPTLHPKNLDPKFEGNVFKKIPNFDKRWELALGMGNGTDNDRTPGHCPVDADPFLPWIHDAFPSNNGSYVELVISNKRRCNTDSTKFRSDLKNLEPQVALMQPIPVRRVKEREEDKIGAALKRLWSPDLGSKHAIDYTDSSPRYILGTSLDDADADGKLTRFICRFHTVMPEGGVNAAKDERLKKIIIGETFSTYPYNPEHVNYRKRGSKPMLTSLEKGKDEQLWNAVYTARCPVPRAEENDNTTKDDFIAGIIASGKSVLRGAPSIYLDLIPIRTPTRQFREGFSLPGVNASSPGGAPLFDPEKVWGSDHVLPRVEASGRWTNIPICNPPAIEVFTDNATATSEPGMRNGATINPPGNPHNKTHFLVACVWASQSFSTRGQTTYTDSSTSARLREFLAYHTGVAGFDHVYVYDNSDPSDVNLSAVTKFFPSHIVSRIPWPHRVCNNNRPMHANPGERSSQYAAENSCRARYGPDTTWMAALDVDEYLIPTGKQWKNIRHWLEHVTSSEDSTKILSFYQTRALPNVDLMIPYEGSHTSSCKVDRDDNVMNSMCLMKDPSTTYMETYNCEPTTHPKPMSWAWRAKKQIYRPDFVLNHFVHYSVVTRRILDKPLETSPRFAERAPFERRVNELTEGFLLHTKTTGSDMTSKWRDTCLRKGMGSDSSKNPCKVGIASPVRLLGKDEMNSLARGDGTKPSSAFESNCYRHSRIISEWVPKLEAALLLLDKASKFD